MAGRDFGVSLGDRYRQMQDEIRSAAQGAGRIAGDVGRTFKGAYSGGSLFGIPLNPVMEVAEGFQEGVRGPLGPVGSDGIPEYLRAPEPVSELEQHIANATAPPPAQEPIAPAAPPPQSRVAVTIGGKTYDYSKGERAPSLFDRNAGPVEGSAFGREYSPASGGGTFSQMNALDPSMKTVDQLQDETEQIRARPASAPGAPEGFTQGDVLDIQKAGLVAAQDPKARRFGIQDALREEAMRDLQTLEAALRQQGRPEEQIRQRMDAAARDLFLMLGMREGEYGALGSYLKPTGFPVG